MRSAQSFPKTIAIRLKSSQEVQYGNCVRLSEQIREMMFVLRFFLAPLSCDSRIRRRVEAAIALSLYAALGTVGTFQDQGIRYWPRTIDEQPMACKAGSLIPLLGLSERFWA
jgi:hypothetical protein